MTRVNEKMLTRIYGILCCLALLLGGCESEEDEEGSPTMRPGEACLSCHGEGGPAGHDLTVAGTLFTDGTGSQGLEGSTIRLYDDNGALLIELTTNSVGNFYTAEPVTFPASVEVDCGATATMGSPAGSGNCNSCHNGSAQDFAFCQSR